MKKILFALILLGGLAFIHGCYYDNPPKPLPFDCEDVSYSTHILPIFEKSCATTGCHDGNREPNLKSDVAWTNLRSGGYINLLLPEESSLLKTVNFEENPMPPGGPQISELNRELILCWITTGGLND